MTRGRHPRPQRRRRTAALIAGCVLVVAGCETPDWLGAPEDPPLKGERLSILSLQQTLEPDPRIADLQVRLPRPQANDAWPQAGGYANHAMHHLRLGDTLQEVWRARIGAGSAGKRRLLSSPVVATDRVFALDAEGDATAFEAASGRRLWRVDLTPEEEDEGTLGGGVAYYRGRIYVTTGYGEVVALDAVSGAVAWRVNLGIPLRAPPAVADGRVFAISFDNQLHVLATDDGRLLWSHVGIEEVAGLLGAAGPAVDGDTVIVPYSSGELFALRVENGRTAWADSLAQIRAATPLGALSDINGQPVIDRGWVFAIGHGGRMSAIDLVSGNRLWDQSVGGVQTPWVAGDFLYVLTSDSEIVCLSRRDGRIRWVTPLPRFEDAEDREGVIEWMGPVLASDRLVVASSSGEALAISPYTGRIMGRIRLPGGAVTAPVLAKGTLYILTDDAELLALR